MIAARVQTPAKVNLGLEIPGKRPDGYHEIVTVLCMIELADTLTVFPDLSRSGTTLHGVPAEQNLVTRAWTPSIARSNRHRHSVGRWKSEYPLQRDWGEPVRMQPVRSWPPTPSRGSPLRPTNWPRLPIPSAATSRFSWGNLRHLGPALEHPCRR